MTEDKLLIKALEGKTNSKPPVWLMRQAGRYLPEYRATRAKAGDFLSLCYNSELAAKVSLQPIDRFNFDAAILFADILLIPQALGVQLKFVEGEGPRLSTINTQRELNNLRPVYEIDATLLPVYETVRILKSRLPNHVALIGFAGAPWTVATYMIAGKGTVDQSPAHNLLKHNNIVFEGLLEKITAATINYLLMQIKSGAEVIQIFDSWAGSLNRTDFEKYCIKPINTIISSLKKIYPRIPIIVFPRGAQQRYLGFAKKTGAQSVAVDQNISLEFMKMLQLETCVQGNLDPTLMVKGGNELIDATKRLRDEMAGGPHIFNLGHGITPDACPKHVELMLRVLRD